MQKWEYITIWQNTAPLVGGIFYITPDEQEYKYSNNCDWRDVNTLLNELGGRGYELVVASTSSTNAGIYNRTWVLKRPVS